MNCLLLYTEMAATRPALIARRTRGALCTTTQLLCNVPVLSLIFQACQFEVRAELAMTSPCWCSVKDKRTTVLDLLHVEFGPSSLLSFRL